MESNRLTSQQKIELGVFIIGWIMIGWVFWPLVFPQTPFPLTQTATLVIVAPSNSFRDGSWYTVAVTSVDLWRKESNMSISINFSIFRQPNATLPWVAAIQVPHRVENVEVISPFGLSPYGYPRGSAEPKYYPDLDTTDILITIYDSPEGQNVSLDIEFTWKDCIYSSSFDEFVLVLPFGFSFDEAWYQHAKEVLDTSSVELLSPDKFRAGYIGMAVPLDAVVSSARPEPDMVTFGTGRPWMHWDKSVLGNFTTVGSSAVVLWLKSTTLTQIKETLTFLSAVLIGATSTDVLKMVAPCVCQWARDVAEEEQIPEGDTHNEG